MEQPLSRILLKVLALAALLFALYAVDFLNLSLSETVVTAPLILLLVSIMDAAVLSAAIVRLRYYGLRLVAAVLLLFYGVKTFLIGIEAVYLSDALPPAVARSLFVNGLIVAAIFTPVAVWVLGRWRINETAPKQAEMSAQRRPLHWLGRLIVAGIIYLALFIAGGLLLFTPIAAALDPVQAASYAAGFEAPAWLPLFILARGMLWTLLALPAIRGLPVTGASRTLFWPNGVLAGLLFAALMADNLLFPGDIAPTMRAAHFVELFVENFLYGLALVWLFAPRAGA